GTDVGRECPGSERLRQALDAYEKIGEEIDKGEKLLSEAENQALDAPLASFDEEEVRRTVEKRNRPQILAEMLRGWRARQTEARLGLRENLSAALNEFDAAVSPLCDAVIERACEVIRPFCLDWDAKNIALSMPAIQQLLTWKSQPASKPPVELQIGTERLLAEIERVLNGELPAIFQTGNHNENEVKHGTENQRKTTTATVAA
ncbi:MAG TPA: hypothetical protein PLW35_01755, partial [Verrucomicrobiota bacterium]|nr:hypothetical protein [Verrucomicrobiota bacterium]